MFKINSFKQSSFNTFFFINKLQDLKSKTY